MKATKRNHYNPCFWTALWNNDYYEAFARNSLDKLAPRDQVVYALNVKSNRIHKTNVDDVHFEKNLGWAEITFDAAKDFSKRHHPETHDDFLRKTTSEDYPVYLDFEDLLTSFEQLPPYKVLLDVARRQALISIEEQVFLACFVFFQLIRSHAVMSSTLELSAKRGIEKFEHFVMIQWMLSNTQALFTPVAYFGLSRWTFYRTSRNAFPLTDSPVLVRPNSVMIALSPRLLLEISPQVRTNQILWRDVDDIEKSKLSEFRRRTIGNTFREIIFDDGDLLERWQASPEFRQRVDNIRKMKSYNMLISKKREGELWLINALGNQ